MAPGGLLAELCAEFTVCGTTVADVVAKAALDPPCRVLHCVEMWAAAGRVAAAAKDQGYNSATVEIQADPANQDLTSKAGFEYAVGLILQLAKGGLLMMAPVCSSWTFANVSNTKRSKTNPAGDLTYPAVLAGNLMVEVAVFCMLLADVREVFAVVENPCSSLLFCYPPFALAASLLQDSGRGHFVTTDGCCFSPLPVGQRAKKPFKLFATNGTDWMQALAKKCTCGSHIPLMLVNEAGQRSGGKLLKESQTYTWEFAEAILRAWLATQTSAVLSSGASSWRDRTEVASATSARSSGEESRGASGLSKAKRDATDDACCDWKRRC